ncbi:MAG: hypothetical protein JJU29_03800 [Verrucomicrobia bacterium]|nr:hypothetical protein [Verrucomicrobiota bacterium]MCH8510907.1 hypothetical protein [Kiritimatiellia bacterium]
MKHALTILFGALLIAIITPLAQFSTLAMVNHDLETSAASGWVFGLLFAFVLAAVALRLITRKPWLNRGQVVLIFSMLSIAVPIMNLGLVRPLFLSLRAVQQHYVGLGVDTYRRAYQEQSPNWFPVVPTTEGLAHHKADRLLRLLNDDGLARRRQNALNEWLLDLQIEARQVERGLDPREEVGAELLERLEDLGLIEVERIRLTLDRDENLQEVAARLQLIQPVETLYARLRTESAEAAETLLARIQDLDERDFYFVPSVRREFDRGIRGRLTRLLDEQLDAEERNAVLARGRALEEELPALRSLIMQMGERDRGQVQRARREAHEQVFHAMDPVELAEIRTEFIFRSRTQERSGMYAQRPAAEIPNHDLAAMEESVFRTSEEKDMLREMGFRQRIGFVMGQVPAELWRGPLIRWALFFLSIFLFLMCLAEWLRRKWVDRENLAFPLVEVADQLIRHDFRLETAEDLLHPEKRRGMFSNVFWGGFALGMLIMVVEAVGYYGQGTQRVIAWDLTAVFGLRELNNLVFVLSPILIGLFFLVSLEISFSVWTLYLITRVTFLAIGLRADGAIRDPNYVGWASRGFPFEMEQLLGAGVCCGVLLLIKAWGASGKSESAGTSGTPYLPGKLTLAGLIVLPLLMMGFVYDLGMKHIGVMIFFGVVLLLMVITSARLRAETGLPMQQVNYDFTRFPMMFGLSGTMGVKSFLNYFALVFLPVSLLFRLLPQQLENLELARRHQVKGGMLALATLVAFVTALGVGLFSFLLMVYWVGAPALGAGAVGQGPEPSAIMAYPLWVSHFLGEQGLGTFTQIHRTRLIFVFVGAFIFGVLTLLRNRILRFPFHPLGYLLFLFSVYHVWLSPYHKGIDGVSLNGASWLWGSAFVAWGIKSLVIKYGGMNTYRSAKPGFVGLIVGALVALFLINLVDLAYSIRATDPQYEPGDGQKSFVESPAFTPRVY